MKDVPSINWKSGEEDFSGIPVELSSYAHIADYVIKVY